MRKTEDRQMKIGEVDISKIEFDARSRDEIPRLLRGLQYIYCTPEIKKEVFAVLEEIAPPDKDRSNGRPGMDLWKILVLGTLRLNCDWDYDKLREIANEHRTLRLMLHHLPEDEYKYHLQTLRDNVSLLTPETLEKINTIVVSAGHRLVGKKKEEGLNGRCDSWVVETDVHYPTDINLLFDAACKVIVLTSRIEGVEGWRQKGYNIRNVKKLFRRAQNLKSSNAKDPARKAAKEKDIVKAHREYITEVEQYLDKAQESLAALTGRRKCDAEKRLPKIEKYMGYARLLIGQIRRRVIRGESIPHEEKIFSVFEDYTEWICKGKAGITQELGLKVCILEDQHGFTLHHKVMRRQTDEEIAVGMAAAAKAKHPDLKGCSFDKGFHSPGNQERLAAILDRVILPKKGRLSAKDARIEKSEVFVQARRKHSAVESAISAMENHGLDRCLDFGIEGFERYVALAVVARNLQVLGNYLLERELKSKKRREKYNRTRAGKKLKAA
jgi:DNA-binding transcriptional MerR regulator